MATNLPRPLVRFIKRLLSASAVVGGTLIHVATREPVAALTFDDGPCPDATARLLDILAAHDAKATFFMLGKLAARHPDLVARVAAEGHAIGNHSWDHASLPLLNRRGRRLQISWCRDALAPHGARLFRPPFGHQNLPSRLSAARHGYRVVAWSAMAEDWLDDPAERLLQRLRPAAIPGAILLLHDNLYSTNNLAYRDRGPTLEAVDQLLGETAGQLRWVTVPQLLSHGRPRNWHWYKHSDLDWLRRQL